MKPLKAAEKFFKLATYNELMILAREHGNEDLCERLFMKGGFEFISDKYKIRDGIH
ncbi:MAG: hypothetical protein ACI9XO_002464 [Paraglaciecola sp.]|jgi:hypothetical protein